MTDFEGLTEQLRPEGAPLSAPTSDDGGEREAWSVTGLETAAWAARKAAEARKKISEWEAFQAAQIEKIKNAAATEIKRFEVDAEFFEYHLAAYLRSEIAAGRKTKSLALPSGTIKLTARQPKIETDDTALLLWAQNNGHTDLIRTRETLDKTALRKQAQLAEDGVVVIDGEIVPDARWEPQDDSVTFTVADEGVAA